MSAMNRTKLHIKNLPKKLSVSDRESFLKQFNPTEVICFPDNGRMRQRAFAKFADEASAKMALETLQNFVLLGSKLRVEFSIPKPDSSLEASEIAEEEEESQDDSLRSPEELDESAPSPEMIKRIADLLATNRSFYIGVVKLMRVLGIPEDSPRLSNPSPGLVNSLVQNRNLLPHARKRKSDVLITGVLGELQVESTENCRQTDKINFGDVFDIPSRAKKIQVEALTLKSVDVRPIEDIGVFGVMQPDLETLAVADTVTNTEFAIDSESEIESTFSKLSAEEMAAHPAFRNYVKGDPCSALYIKNISKLVSKRDLEKLFQRFSEEAKGLFVQHFASGRMRGQAFVGFAETSTAMRALDDTNGLIIKDKPIVVMFAKAAIER